MKSGNLEKLFEPIKINGMTLRNRIVMPSMDTHYGSPTNEVTEQLLAYHRRRAQGGAGLILVEYTSIDPLGRATPVQLGIYDDRFVPGWKRLTATVHEHGAKIGMQIHHAGVRTAREYTGGQIVGPSAVPQPSGGEVPRVLTVPEIEQLVVAFGQGARRAKEAGCDMVEIHGAHGYLINQFLSPYYNRREDAYGGSFENRMRFALEVIRHVREVVGPSFPVGFRFIGDEMGRGLTIQDTTRIAPRLVEAGIDVLHVSIAATTHPYTVVIAPMALDSGFNVYAASAIKRVVSVPVITVGRINDTRLADQILRDGHADMVAMGRAFLADPEFPIKSAEGRFDEIRKCFACTECAGRPYLYCCTNPELGRETRFDLSPVTTPKTVWVVGGGVAGLEAATLAAKRGHRVALFERGTELGGQILLAATPPHKVELMNAITNRIPLLKKYGVNVVLGTEVTAKMVREEPPDVLIIAAGSQPAAPPIPGIDGHNVVQARDVLAGKAFVGPRVAVLGGGMVGVETAEYLADHCREVTIIEMLDTVAGDMRGIPAAYLMQRLRQLGVQMIVGAKVEAITDHGVLVARKNGSQLLDGFHSIVLSLGNIPNKELAAAAEGVVKEVYVIGDAGKPGRIMDATTQAAEVALQI